MRRGFKCARGGGGALFLIAICVNRLDVEQKIFGSVDDNKYLAKFPRRYFLKRSGSFFVKKNLEHVKHFLAALFLGTILTIILQNILQMMTNPLLEVFFLIRLLEICSVLFNNFRKQT